MGRPARIELGSLELLPVEEAASVLSSQQQPICFGAVDVQGDLAGQMIFAFDDASGFALADVLLEQDLGTTTEWNEMSQSVVLETTNILCCAYLNALADRLTQSGSGGNLIPGPPRFNRDFAESLMEFALMAQAMEYDQVVLAETRFRVDGTPVDGTLLFVPDANSRLQLARMGHGIDG